MGCNQSHPWEQELPNRIHFTLHAQGCCSKPRPVKQLDVPAALAEAGLTQDDWNEFVVDRLREALSPLWTGCATATCCILTAGVSLCICDSRAKANALARVTEWKRDFNDLLEKHGLGVTIKSHAFMIHTGDGRQQRVVSHGLVFALSREEAERMRVERDNTGVTHECGCKCCPCGRDQSGDVIMFA